MRIAHFHPLYGSKRNTGKPLLSELNILQYTLMVCSILCISVEFAHSQPFISSSTPPSCYEVEARVRNGNADHEAVLYTPNTPSPYDPGGKKWQLNPAGSPVWNTNGNTYGDIHSFQFTYIPASGTSIWSLDFNRDGDYTDPKETVTNVAPTLIGKGFKYVNVFGQGNDFGKMATINQLTINGVGFGSYMSNSNTPFSILFEEISGLFNDLVITGQFSFSGQGTSERPRIWVRLGESNVAPFCMLTSPVQGATFSPGSSVNISATATDPLGRITSVEFYEGDTKIGEDLTFPYMYQYENVQSGVLSLRALAIDQHGAMTFSNTVKVFVSGLPSVRIITPSDGYIYFDPDTILLEAEIKDDSLGVVEFFIGDMSLGFDDSPPYVNEALRNHPMGIYSVKVKSTSTSGNISNSPLVSFTVRCIREDINIDGVVNTFDFLLLLGAFGSDCSNTCSADFNDDGAVSTIDFLRLLTKLGHSCL